jgi:transcriptional regulator of arginine metabolism
MHKIHSKKKRQETLRQIIYSNQVSAHHELIDELKGKGFAATQSSISRDLNELGIIKKGGYYYLPSSVSEGQITPPLTSIVTAGKNLLVLKTLPSMAPSMASIIDSQKLTGVLGTVAGDDTVFVAISPKTTADAVSKKLQNIFQPIPSDRAGKF